MRKYLFATRCVNLLFAFLMAACGLWTLWGLGLRPAVFGVGLIGLVCLGSAVYGWCKNSLYPLAGGSLASGLLWPTPWGAAPMIFGFVLFILSVSLRIFIDCFERDGN